MAVIYEKGIVVIPKDIRQKAGLREGAKVCIWADDGTVMIREDRKQIVDEFEELCRTGRAAGKPVEEIIKRAEARRRRDYLHVP